MPKTEYLLNHSPRTKKIEQQRLKKFQIQRLTYSSERRKTMSSAISLCHTSNSRHVTQWTQPPNTHDVCDVSLVFCHFTTSVETSGLSGVSVLSPGAPKLWEQCPLAVNLCFPAGGEDQQHANKPPLLRSEAAGAKTLASLWDSSPHHDDEPNGPSSASQLLPTNLLTERISFIKLFRETWPQFEIAT